MKDHKLRKVFTQIERVCEGSILCSYRGSDCRRDFIGAGLSTGGTRPGILFCQSDNSP